MSYIDLHTHTTASDGTDTPSELVQNAIKANLSAIAITDHDTVDGVKEALFAAQNTPLSVISGIELSCFYKGTEIHMLGYFIDYQNTVLLQKLKQLKEERNLRNERMRQKLCDAGMPLTMEEITGTDSRSVITRAHFAKAMKQAGYVKTLQEAFEKYIGDGCPCYVLKPEFAPESAISLIREANGLAVLAHPLLYHFSYAELESLLAHLKEVGLTGVEVYHSSHNTGNSQRLRELIRPYGLLPTGGSDYHGANKAGVLLGKGYGSMAVSNALLTDLKKLKN